MLPLSTRRILMPVAKTGPGPAAKMFQSVLANKTQALHGPGHILGMYPRIKAQRKS